MRRSRAAVRSTILPFFALTLASCHAAAQATTNRLTATEQQGGWVLLFDGKSTAGWRGYQKPAMPDGWTVVDGALTRTGEGGDIITTGQYTSFELALEWKLWPGGNSGLMYRVTEAEEWSYRTGPEMQLLDDVAHADGLNRLTAAGSAYGLYAAPAGIVRPAGEWNMARIVVQGSQVEHWLNGVKVVSYELGSADWEAKVAASKFKEWPGYGRAPRGHIALQDHGDRVAFRNIKIREIK